MTTIYVGRETVLPERKENDVYETEHTLIAAALEQYSPRAATTVLDIGAGDGRWGQAAKDYTDACALIGVEIRNINKPEKYDLWYPKTDFMTWDTPIMYSLIVSNPPYFIAEEIIRKAWGMLDVGGTMIFLLRLAFQAGVGRYYELWNELPPVKVGVLSRRPSFYGNGTNGTDYGLFIWKKGYDGAAEGCPRSWITDLLYYEREKKEKNA